MNGLIKYLKNKREDINNQLGDGEIIEGIEKFTYLGNIISKEGGVDEDVNVRIKKARFAFTQLNSVWKSTSDFLKTQD